jgi:hypothetical protein
MILAFRLHIRRYLLVFIALQLADLITTSWNLSHSGFAEFNPIVGYVWMHGIEVYIVFKLLQVTLVTWILAQSTARIIFIAAIALSVLPVLMNIIALGRWVA